MNEDNKKDEPVTVNEAVHSQHESFADMFEKSSKKSTRLDPGQKIRSKVVSVSADFAYVDLGGKSEGVVDIQEFKDKNGVIQVKEGDEIEAFFVSVQDGVRRMTTLIRGYSAIGLKSIRDAYEADIPVQGEIKREIKGGFEVMAGDVRCFCPFSQIDLRGGREGGIYLGRVFPFKVIEFGEEGRNVIVSRRAILENELKEKVAKLKETLLPGKDVNGTVRSIMRFGVFVDLGGVDGLIPASEISWARGDKSSDVLASGQEVTARILSVDWENNKFTLSLKALEPDPWTGMKEKYPDGSRVSGKISRLAPFGAFVNIEPGIDGLIHISNLGTGRRINHPKEVVEVGQTVEAYVQSVDIQSRKISLSMNPKAEPQEIILPEVGEVLEGTVERIMPYGIFLKVKSGLVGLIPNSEMGTAHGSDHKKMFPEGTEMKVGVVDVDRENNKVRLSRKAAMDMSVKQEYQEYLSETKQSDNSSSGFGTFGDLLKEKIAEKK